ncbi:MAG: RHS repeat-associated core domain-containing protein, partial [Gammaproteobacteria bacterium]|nr:RHS repeat-associated core domain-containing protein [Gammaproteobacteria bacterium]
VHTAYEYDKNDRLKKQGGFAYQYDDNGNLTEEVYENKVTRYAWNDAGRLTEVENETGGTVTSAASYLYDPDGNRIQSTTGDKTVRYVVDDNQSLVQVIAEFDGNGLLLATYLHGENLVSLSRGGNTHYYHYDGLGSTRTLTNAAGNITDNYTYTAYGKVFGQSGNTENSYLYTGELYDPAQDSYYLRERYYQVASKRFLSMDNFAGFDRNPVTLNKYLYGNVNPVNFVDPT